MDLFLTSVRSYIRSAAVKVTALLGERLSEESAVWAIGYITRCSERELAEYFHLIRTFLKMSKPSTLDSFDTELYITEVEKLPAIWDSDRLSTAINK